jgi:hypothetical protein
MHFDFASDYPAYLFMAIFIIFLIAIVIKSNKADAELKENGQNIDKNKK